MIHTCWEVVRLIYYIKYMYGSSQPHCPLLDMAGMVLTYKNVELLNNETPTQLR